MKTNMQVNRIQKKVRLNAHDLIKYQIMTEVVFFGKEHLIPSDMELLTLLALWGPVELVSFCSAAAKHLYPDIKPEEIAVRSQNVRNRIVKLEKRGLVEKSKKGKKMIQVAEKITLASKGNVLLDYNFLSVETSKA
jgi:hypothetical protein